MASTRSGATSSAPNQAQKLAAAAAAVASTAAVSSLDMPVFGSAESLNSNVSSGPTTRRRVASSSVEKSLNNLSADPQLQPLAKAPRVTPAQIQPQKMTSSVYTVPTVLPKLPGLRTGTPMSGAAAAKAAAANAKAEKGLRHFSARVCAKVEEKGCTSYNEVADELVTELGSELGFDSKNIRRRVYDALNVLMAIDVIEKDKKEIRWLGLSNETTNELSGVESELQATQKRLEEKQKVLKDLIQRKIALHGLISRNSRSQNSINAQTLSSTSLLSESNIDGSRADRLYLPFILINASRDCRVHCEMLEDRTQYFFEFDMSFFINEDIELLRLMGLDNATPEELRTILSPEIHSYYQSRLKSSLPVNDAGPSSNQLPSRSMTSGTSASASIQQSPKHAMSSPIRLKRSAPNGASTLRNQIITASSSSSSSVMLPSLTAAVHQSPQPIGQTGIFRKTSRSSSATGTLQTTPKRGQQRSATQQGGLAAAATARNTPPPAPRSPGFGIHDDLSRFGFSFSDIGGIDHVHRTD